jgi:hypothetical protein
MDQSLEQLTCRSAGDEDRNRITAEPFQRARDIDAAAARVAPPGSQRSFLNGSMRATDVDTSMAGFIVRVTSCDGAALIAGDSSTLAWASQSANAKVERRILS